jgi:hypothetical protein
VDYVEKPGAMALTVRRTGIRPSADSGYMKCLMTAI